MRKVKLIVIILSLLLILGSLYIIKTNATDSLYKQAVANCLQLSREKIPYCISDNTPEIKNLKTLNAVSHVLYEAEKKNAEVTNSCHYSLHEASYQLPPKYIYEALKTVEIRSCTYALVHGLLESFGLSHPTQSAIIAMSDLCKGQENTDTAWECAHGLGHGLWFAYRDYNKVIKMCQTLDSFYYVSSCDIGLFMEVYYPTLQDKFSSSNKKLNDQSLTNFCSSYKDPVYSPCMQGVLFPYLHGEYEKIATEALKFAPGDVIPQDTLSLLTTYSKEALLKCEDFPSRGASICKKSGWQFILIVDDWFLKLPEVRKAVCKGWDISVYKTCSTAEDFQKKDIFA